MNLPTWLWPLAGLTGLGVFADFLLGRANQARVRGYLETWWIKFADVRINHFGIGEALYAISLLDRWFGRHFFSRRRGASVSLVLFSAASVGYVIGLLRCDPDSSRNQYYWFGRE